MHVHSVVDWQHCLLDCRTISANLVSAQPSLATVPEGSTINTGLSTGMPAMHYTSDALVPTEDLSSMSVEELQAELIRTRQAFHSAGTLHNLPQALEMVCCGQLHGTICHRLLMGCAVSCMAESIAWPCLWCQPAKATHHRHQYSNKCVTLGCHIGSLYK